MTKEEKDKRINEKENGKSEERILIDHEARSVEEAIGVPESEGKKIWRKYVKLIFDKNGISTPTRVAEVVLYELEDDTERLVVLIQLARMAYTNPLASLSV